MSDSSTAHIDFRANTQHVEPNMPRSVQKATAKFLGNRAALIDIFGHERWETLRQAGHEMRLHTARHLDAYLIQLEASVTAAGGHVHWARDAEEARQIVLQIAREHNVKAAVKVKSMASEEIHLNHALQAAGIEVLETDLGEYIVQLAGVGPAHIVVPAVHLTKEGIANLFCDKLGVDAPAEPTALTAVARGRLREAFLAADMGISGANFLVAETGTLVTVTNEGNGRMCTTLPPLHVAVVGIDKVVPDWESLTIVLKLLARSATGQKLSAYTQFVTGPRRDPAENGPEEFHLVLLDGGRTQVLADPVTRETAACIRCGACLNVCPVYNHVGGHAYGSAYSGPIGSMLATQLLGTEQAGDLPYACTLCGACADTCPVKIPIPEILLHLRHRVCEGDDIVERPTAAPEVRAGVEVMTRVLALPWLYEFGTQVLRLAQAPWRRGDWLPALPPPVSRWTMSRPFMAFRGDFRDWFRERTPEGREALKRRRMSMGAAIGVSLGLLAVGIGLRLGQKKAR